MPPSRLHQGTPKKRKGSGEERQKDLSESEGKESYRSNKPSFIPSYSSHRRTIKSIKKVYLVCGGSVLVTQRFWCDNDPITTEYNVHVEVTGFRTQCCNFKEIYNTNVTPSLLYTGNFDNSIQTGYHLSLHRPRCVSVCVLQLHGTILTRQNIYIRLLGCREDSYITLKSDFKLKFILQILLVY